MRSWACVALFALVMACGGSTADPPRGSCGFTIDQTVCVEYQATTTQALETARDSSCGASRWTSAACPTGDRVGGCLTVFNNSSDGSTTHALFWYYPSAEIETAADVMAECAQSGAAYVPPEGGFPALP